MSASPARSAPQLSASGLTGSGLSAPGREPSASGVSVGHREGLAAEVDLTALTERVYALMLEDLRTELARRTGKVR